MLTRVSCFVSVAALLGTATTHADTFESVRYSPKKDELIVNIIYRGTNPNHGFSIRWDECKGTNRGKEITAGILDDQWQDKAEKDFRKTVRFQLKDVQCRPAHLTLRTAPNFIYSISLPERR